MPNNKLLVVEDDVSVRSLFVDVLQASNYQVLEAGDGKQALELLAKQQVGLVLCDEKMSPMDGSTFLREVCMRLPGLPVLMISGYATVKLAVDAIHHGAVDYLVKPVGAHELIEAVKKYLPEEGPEFLPPDNASGDGDKLIAVDPRTLSLLALAQRAASTNTTVLLHGASGVGKEVLARYLHNHSSHRDGPFVAINCAAIPATMLEAVLFGYEKGAFTGALNRAPGKFESAQNGTLLLDEISEMDLDLQAKLLRVLQERELEPLGGRHTIKLNVRIIATTNRNLANEVSEGRFRQDLFYRLSVFPLEIPTLAERPADIIPLAEHILRRIAKESGKNLAQLATPAKQSLIGYHWPGNVRELENVLQRAMILSDGSQLQASHLKFDAVSVARFSTAPYSVPKESGHWPSPSQYTPCENLRSALQERESEQLLDVLRASANRTEAATSLGISERTLRYKLSRLRESGVSIPRHSRLSA